MSQTDAQMNQVSGDKIDPEAYVSVELATSQSIVQLKRKKIDLKSSDDRKPPEETKRR